MPPEDVSVRCIRAGRQLRGVGKGEAPRTRSENLLVRNLAWSGAWQLVLSSTRQYLLKENGCLDLNRVRVKLYFV
jgi:hypothetical protein